MLVHAHTVVIFVTEINLASVEEYLDGIVAAGSKLDRSFLLATQQRVCVPRGAHMLAESFVEIDDPQWIGRDVRLPDQRLILLALIGCLEIDAFFRGIYSLEACIASVVEWANKHPSSYESEPTH